MSVNRDSHGEESPLAGGSEAGSPKTQASSGSFNTISDADATQGSDEETSTPPSSTEPTTDEHLDLSALDAEPAPDAAEEEQLPRGRPRDETTAPQEMSDEIARIMRPFYKHAADTERDPKPPSDS